MTNEAKRNAAFQLILWWREEAKQAAARCDTATAKSCEAKAKQIGADNGWSV